MSSRFIYHYFSDKPFVRLVLPFIAGIFLFRLAPQPFHLFLLCVLLFIGLVLFIFHVLYKKYSVLLENMWGVLLNVFFVIWGYLLASWHYPEYKEQVYTKDRAAIVGTIKQKPEAKEKSVKALLQIQAIKVGNEWQKAEGNSLIYFEKDERSMQLKSGDELLLNAKLNVPDNAGNPNEFDYKKYLLYHLISTSGYVKAKDWVVISKQNDFSLVIYAEQLRDYFLNILRKLELPDDVFAITSAIVLGYKNEIDAEIRQAYASAGATHILAVSGLHVGVVYLIINTLLTWLRRNKYLKYMQLALILPFLWFYALITGLSPSVLRATTMFSFVAIARFTTRQTNIYNTLSASALLLLMIQPFQLFEIGFQLSYVAVIGIVFFQSKFKQLLTIKNKFLDSIWSLVCVTLAAQLATSPLSIYYFNQFPVYFLLSGIVLVPLVSLVIYNAIALFVFSWWQPLAYYLSLPLKYLVGFMNQFTLWVEQLPYAVIQPIYLDLLLMILVYAFILLLSYYFITKKIKLLRLSLVSLFVLSLLLLYREYQILNQRKIVVYNIPGVSALNLIDGRDNIFFTDADFKEKATRAASASWVKFGLDKEKTLHFNNLSSQYLFSNLLTIDNPNVWYYRDVLVFYKHRILILNNDTWYKLSQSLPQLNVDMILVQHKAKVDFSKLLRCVKTNTIVFDSSCSPGKIKRWLAQLTEFKGEIHVVSNQKAWMKNLN